MFTISAFADEISPDPQKQIDILKSCGVRHIELYCKPELIPFYKQWGFISPGPEVNFLRMTRV